MKINQLFIKSIDDAMLNRILDCYSIKDLNDRRLFSKHELLQHNSINKLNCLKEELMGFYLPCKAKLYLSDITEKRAITILKQILRLFNYCLLSKEKNYNNKKLVFYQLTSTTDKNIITNLKKNEAQQVLKFD